MAHASTLPPPWQRSTARAVGRDILGLYFGCQEPYEDYVDPVPVSYAGAADAGVTLTMKPAGAKRVVFDPYPFDARPCRGQLSFKRVAQRTFENVEAFRRPWFQAL